MTARIAPWGGAPGRRTRGGRALAALAAAAVAAVAAPAAQADAAPAIQAVETPASARPDPSRTPIVATPTPVAMPDTPPDAAAGHAIYRDRCASCHGPYGRGDGEMADRLPAPPPRLDDPERMRQASPAELYDIITNGRIENGMPPWSQALDAQERWQALYAAWSFYLTPRRLARGRAVWGERCAACHALAGPSSPGQADGAEPRAPGARPFDAAWLASRSHADLFAGYAGAAGGAHAALGAVEDADLRAALDFVRTAAFHPLGPADGTLDGVITGQVINGTAGAARAAGARVVAVPFSHALGDILPGDPVTATVGAAGTFTLTQLLAGSDVAYRVVATYGGADYVPPDPVPLTATAARAEAVDVTVYEPSEDVSLDVSAARLVVVPRPEAGVLDVAEAWTIRNPSDRTLVGAGGDPTLRLPLLPGAFEIQIDDPRVGGRARLDGDDVVSDVPVPPGDFPVIVGYSAPYSGTTAEIDRRIAWPVERLDVVVSGEAVAIASDVLSSGPATTLGERGAAATASGTGLAAGARLRIALSGLPEATTTAASPRLTQPLAPALVSPALVTGTGIGMALLAAIIGIGLPLARRRRAGARADRWLMSERERLVAEIARLDRRRAESTGATPDAAGDLSARRARLVDRALAVSRALSEAEEESQ